MARQIYDGFSLKLPDGWSDAVDDATFSDTGDLPPVRFSATIGAGSLLVGAHVVHPDEPACEGEAELEELARDWGRRRGQPAPLAWATKARPDGAIATAIYRLAEDFVQLWYLSNGRTLVHASYVCPWERREEEALARDAIATSLRFA